MLDFGDICRNLSEIHPILSEIQEKTAGIWKMRMRVDHGHMQFKIVTNRDEISFLPLKIMTFVGNTVTKRDKKWSVQDLPLILYGLTAFYGNIMVTANVKKQGLPQMSANRPNIWSTGKGVKPSAAALGTVAKAQASPSQFL